MNLAYYRPVTKIDDATYDSDLCIYGATPAGITAAIQARRLGLTARLLAWDDRVGGMSTSGLGCTDIGKAEVIGGLAREFYNHVGQIYERPTQWFFEPHVADQVFRRMLDEAGVEVHTHQHLTEVKTRNKKIESITVEGGITYRARIFVDATYEGDLLAKAGVSYFVGREANSVYRETLSGIQFGHPYHNFQVWVDPYNIPGKPDSGLLPEIGDSEPGYQGQGDRRIQAYNFRLCLTSDPANRVPYPKPDDYDPWRYELLIRYIQAGISDLRIKPHLPNYKTDFNNYGAFSTDVIGRNWGWPEGSYAERERIFQDHVSYTQGLMYCLANDKRIPQEYRDYANQWGLTRDEFQETGGWSPHLYVREGRRMISSYVMTEHNCLGRITCPDSIGLGSYQIDSHHCRRLVIDGRVVNEGDVEIPVKKPYPISYRSIVPCQDECTNLFVPVCLSASHIAYGSIRMEPVFMILGQSAAVAAALSLELGCDPQDLPYSVLQPKLEAVGQKLYTDAEQQAVAV